MLQPIKNNLMNKDGTKSKKKGEKGSRKCRGREGERERDVGLGDGGRIGLYKGELRVFFFYHQSQEEYWLRSQMTEPHFSLLFFWFFFPKTLIKKAGFV